MVLFIRQTAVQQPEQTLRMEPIAAPLLLLAAGGKGMLSVVGGGSNITWRSSNLIAHIDGNTINNTTYRTDYSAVDGPRIGRQTAAIASFSANVDTSIPSTPSAPTTPTLAAS